MKSLAFPMQIDQRTGGWLVRTDKQAILVDRVFQMALTGFRERVMLPDFGTALWEKLWSPLDSNFAQEVLYEVQQAGNVWEPEISFLDAYQETADTSVTVMITAIFGDQEVEISLPIQKES